jgi:hypothetical protein
MENAGNAGIIISYPTLLADNYMQDFPEHGRQEKCAKAMRHTRGIHVSKKNA